MTLYRVPVNVSWNGNGSPGVNVWSLRTAGAAGDQAELDAGLDSLKDFYTTINQIGTSDMKWTLGDVVNRDNGEFAAVTPWTVQCTNGTIKAPPVLQIVVSWRTSLAARRGMGRTFLGPCADGLAEADGTILNGFVTTLQTAANTLISDSAVTNGWAWGVYGLESPAPVGSTSTEGLPHVHRDFKSARIKDKFAVLRSRRD